MTSSRTDPAAWWRSAVTYQVYPRSFADGDGDGVGDIAGIRSRLPYIRDLGVDAIWLNPWYPSPMADAGYDIADYRAIDPLFGTLAEAEAFIAEARALGLRVLLDIVPNHMSSEHPWFRAALATGPGSQERARFLFRPGRGDGTQPPNDWESVFGGSAWTRIREPDGKPGEWYLHLFDPGQPDLNWTEPDVHAEFESVLRFWFDRGVDGFRIDVANGLHKHEDLPDLGERSGRPGRRRRGGPPVLGPRHRARGVSRVAPRCRLVSRSEDVRCRGLGPDPGTPRAIYPPRSSPQRLQFRLPDDAVAGTVAPGEHRRRTRGARSRQRRTDVGAVEPRRRPCRQPSRCAAAQRTEMAGDRAGRDRRTGPRPRDATRSRRGTPDARTARRCLHLPGRGARALGGPGPAGRRCWRIPSGNAPDTRGAGAMARASRCHGLRTASRSGSDRPTARDPGCRNPPRLPQWPRSGRPATPPRCSSCTASALRIRREHPGLGSGPMRWRDAPNGVLAIERDGGFLLVANVEGAPFELPTHREVLLASGPLDGSRLPPNTAVWLQT